MTEFEAERERLATLMDFLLEFSLTSMCVQSAPWRCGRPRFRHFPGGRTETVRFR